jgi:hypothetical protein
MRFNADATKCKHRISAALSIRGTGSRNRYHMAKKTMASSTCHEAKEALAQPEPPCVINAFCVEGANVDSIVPIPHKEFSMQKLALSAALVSVALLSGCASILNEKTQQINVTSSNGKAIKGSVDDRTFIGPGVVSVQRKKASKIFNVETEGCVKQTVVENTVDTKFFINILSGGTFGSSTDFATEKMWKYADNVVISCAQ